MQIGETLIWYSLSVLWLIVATLGIVRLKRSLRGDPGFTGKDWRVLFGFPRDKLITSGFWVRVALANLIVMAAGFGIGLFLLPYGVGWMIAAVAFSAAVVVILLGPIRCE